MRTLHSEDSAEEEEGKTVVCLIAIFEITPDLHHTPFGRSIEHIAGINTP
jgi:hypothetical protein